MNTKENIVQNICKIVAENKMAALSSHHLTEKQIKLIEPEVLTIDQVEFYDLNQLIISVIQNALPACQQYGVKVILQQDPCLPLVPIFVKPLEDAFAVALDMCIGKDVGMLKIVTRVERDRVVAILERWTKAPISDDWEAQNFSDADLSFGWTDVGTMGQVELMVGDRTTRALGGRMVIMRRESDLRMRVELPVMDRPTVRQRVSNNLQSCFGNNKDQTFPGAEAITANGCGPN